MASARAPLIVGIGASAGGLEALEALFSHMPRDDGIGFVVVTHMAAKAVSAMVEILGRAAAMPVREAADGEVVKGGEISVIAPGTLLTIAGGRLRVQPVGAHHELKPIDLFLASLAADQRERAVAIILSGAGSDGTLGLKAVKEQGGLAVAQGSDGTSPRHPSMPTSAIETGVVDLVLPAEAIGPKLVDYARSFNALSLLDNRPGSQSVEEARQAICAILRDQVGHDFSGYKDRTFLRRVQRRMQVLQLSELAAFVERLRQDPGEVLRLFHDLLIGVTTFFRDEAAFAALEKLVMPGLFEGKSANDSVRVWVPGCSTGEEVYSVAMLLREQLDKLDVVPKVQIFATDIDEPALQTARAARYPAAMVDGVSPARLKRFFTHDGSSYVLSKQLRDMCTFSTHSLIRDPPYSRIDLISCRNLLIYLGTELQGRIIPLFHYALRPGGYLFLGSAEGVTQHSDLFAALDKKHRIFQRRAHSGSTAHLPLLVQGLHSPLQASWAPPEPSTTRPMLRRTVETRVLERFAPAHVVVNRNGEVVYYSQRTGKYLEPPSGQPSRQVRAMARNGLRLDLRNALQDAMETRRQVVRRHIPVEIDDYIQHIDLMVEPLADQDGPLFLILFQDLGPLLQPEQIKAGGYHEGDSQLESELRDTRERLQSTIEEYETALEELKSANEELVSVNEEIQSTNEELETSKEEVQSINEELQTVNHELNSKINELNQANADLHNLFESTQLAILFLDRHVRIRSFTPPVAELFSLIPADQGRLLADMATHIDYPDIAKDVQAVLTSEKPVEQQVSRRDGRTHYLARVLPYRDSDGCIDGVIITFIDITQMVEGERRQQVLVHELNHRVRNILTVVSAIATQTLARTPDPVRFVEAFQGRIQALGRAHGLVAREQWRDVPLAAMIREEVEPHLVGAGDGSRLTLDGPPVMLPSRSALAFGMVVHELATNALKYGALSMPEGRIVVGWRVDGDKLHWQWRESGGPVPRPPEITGFGTDLIRRQVSFELRGDAQIAYPPTGLEVKLELPLPAGPPPSKEPAGS